MQRRNCAVDIFDIFDVIIIINLDRRTDRLRDMKRQLASVGLALDGIRVIRLSARSFDDRGAYPTAGTRGCFASHRDAWTRASEVNSVLVLEDDVDFVHHFAELARSVRDALDRTNWDIFYGGALNGTPGESAGPIMPCPSDWPIMGAHFIAMRGQALAKIADYLDAMDQRPAGALDGGPMHVDGAYSWFRKTYPEMRTYLANPQLVTQRPSKTDIHDLTWKDRVPLVREAVGIGRRIKRGASQLLARRS